MLALFRKWRKDMESWYGAMGLASVVVGTSSILIPLMIAQVLHGTVENVGLLSSMASLMGVIGSLVWGRLSDVAHRRKPFVVMSYTMVAVSFAGMAFAQSLTLIVLLNMVLNLFWVANASVCVLLVIENRDESQWESRIGSMNQLVALGWVLGLIFGSVALAIASSRIGEAAAIRSVFGTLAFGGAVAAILAVHFVPRTRPKYVRRRFHGSILALGNMIVERAKFAPSHLYHRFNPRLLSTLLLGQGGLRRETKGFLVAMLLAFAAFGFFFVPLPILLADKFAFSSSRVFSFFVVLNGAIVAAYPFAARRIKRLGNKSVLTGSLLVRVLLFALSGASLLALPSAPSSIIIAAFFLAVGASWSFFQLSSVAMISRLARPEYRGQALGLYNAVAGLGTIIAGVASGLMAQHWGYAATSLSSAILAASAMIVVSSLRIPRRKAQAVEKIDESGAPTKMSTQAQLSE